MLFAVRVLPLDAGPGSSIKCAVGLMTMQDSIFNFDADYFVYGGSLGILLGLLFLALFSYRRIRWLIARAARRNAYSPGVLASLRNLVFILLWSSLFSVLLFVGLFVRAYYAFNEEQPVAEVAVQGQQRGRAPLIQVSYTDARTTRYLFLRGDQWMLEGDILKWDPWLNFLGFHTRYRLTRLRGRYLSTEDERRQPQTIHSLVDSEDDPLWRQLYRLGAKMPFVSTVYGNAAFQVSENQRRYLVYVGTSGFVVREADAESDSRAPPNAWRPRLRVVSGTTDARNAQ